MKRFLQRLEAAIQHSGGAAASARGSNGGATGQNGDRGCMPEERRGKRETRGEHVRAVCIWALALCLIGAAVVVATDPLKERGPDLSSALLDADQFPSNWTATRLQPARADQLLVTPCSQTPVVSGAEQVGFAGRQFSQSPTVGPFIDHIVVATGSQAAAAGALAALRTEASGVCPSNGAPQIAEFPSITDAGMGDSALAVHRSYTDATYGTVDEITVISNTGANIVLVRQLATRGETADLDTTLAYAVAATDLAAPSGVTPLTSRSTLVGSSAERVAFAVERAGEHRSSIIRGAVVAGLFTTLLVAGIFVHSRIRELRRRRATLRALTSTGQTAQVPRRRVPTPIIGNSTLDIGQKLLKIKEMNRRDRDHDTASMRAVKLQQQMLIDAGIIDRLNAESRPVARG